LSAVAYSICHEIVPYASDGSLKSTSVADMFSLIVPPFLACASTLLDAAPANAAATSMLVPMTAAVAESQSLLFIALLSGP